MRKQRNKINKKALDEIMHFYLTKGSVLLIKSENISQEQVDEISKAIKKKKIGFRVPVIGLDRSGSMEVENINTIIEQLQTFKKRFL